MNAHAQPLSDETPDCKRSLGRAVLGIRSSLATTANTFLVEIADLSLRGAGIVTPRPLEVAQAVWLDLGRIKVFGEVKWCRGSHAGIEFEEALPKAVVLNLRGEVVDAMELAKAEARMAARDWVVGMGGYRSRAERLAEVLGWGGGARRASGARGDTQHGKVGGWFTLRRRRGETVPRMMFRITLASVVTGGLAGVLSAMLF
ncbi:PilZ domain-containing protein [Erythrobacter sp. NE805]|uniref:PilZ domain-containing protein n=1 Tax=Erythrobacter sp. NE805 TaxID=3389875 RepID=UPI00396AFB13